MAHQNTDNSNHASRSHRGFAAMDAEKQRQIASKGGQSQGKANNPGNFANNRQKAAEAGRKGGLSSGGNRDNLSDQGQNETVNQRGNLGSNR